jgi:hypothetical protein
VARAKAKVADTNAKVARAKAKATNTNTKVAGAKAKATDTTALQLLPIWFQLRFRGKSIGWEYHEHARFCLADSCLAFTI